jgi:hypothetical protein
MPLTMPSIALLNKSHINTGIPLTKSNKFLRTSTIPSIAVLKKFQTALGIPLTKSVNFSTIEIKGLNVALMIPPTLLTIVSLQLAISSLIELISPELSSLSLSPPLELSPGG